MTQIVFAWDNTYYLQWLQFVLLAWCFVYQF